MVGLATVVFFLVGGIMSAKKLAQDALDIQDGCNLTGIVHGFSRAVSVLRESCPDKGTDWYNHHPICVLWADKIAQLAGVQNLSDTDTYSKSYRWCIETAFEKRENELEYK